MVKRLFGESALKGPRICPTISNFPAELDYSVNVNYIQCLHTVEEEDKYYSRKTSQRTYHKCLSSPGFTFLMDGYGALRIRSRYHQVRLCVVIVCWNSFHIIYRTL